MRKSPFIPAITAGLTIALASPLAAQGIQAKRTKPWSTEQQQKSFKLADGFVIELVASEENGLVNPIDLTFDDAGQLWTQTAQMYPMDPIPGINFGQAMRMMKDQKLIDSDPRFEKIRRLYQLKTRGKDKILVVKDPTQQAKGPLHVWADGLTIPQSILPYKDGCYVAHGSEMLYLKDTDKDGKQDKAHTLFTGFGFFDTHTMSHSLVRGPGRWIHFSHGAVNSGKVKSLISGQELQVTYCKNLRFDLAAKKMEIINCWRDNLWGYQIKADGQWYGTSANDGGYSVLPIEPMTSINGLGGEKVRPYQPFFPPIHKFRVGATGISGLAFSEDGASGFPAEWKDIAILANPITQSLNCVSIVRNADGSVTAKHLKDLLKSGDEWFRPVNIEFGPDGCLYIADWYNKIVSHNEVSTDHPDRDRKHGRIWRIRHQSQKPRAIPNLIKAKKGDLVKHLSAPILWEKRAAWHQIVDRDAKELAPALHRLVKDTSKDAVTRIHALWSVEGLGVYNTEMMLAALASKDANLQREAIRSMASFKLSASEVATLLGSFVESSNAMIRSQVLRTLEEVGTANDATLTLLIRACKPAAPNDQPGGNYERNFERFLARKALEGYRVELKAFLAKPVAYQLPSENLLWALQALTQQERTDTFLKIWQSASGGTIDPNTFVAISMMLDDPKVRAAVAPAFQKRPEEMLKIALKTHDRINGPKIAEFYNRRIAADLTSGSPPKISAALDVILKLRTPAHSKILLKMITAKSPVLDQIFTALGNDKKLASSQYREFFYNSELPFAFRLKSLAASAIKSPQQLTSDIMKWLPHLDETQKQKLVSKLTWSKQGNSTLLHLWELGLLETTHWKYRSAQRSHFSAKSNWRGKQLFEHYRLQEEKMAKARTAKVHHYMKSFKKLKGDPASGKALFGMCLACHSANGEGQNIAPSLDGSSNRDTEHLLTAMLNPDEAVEGAYGLYYVLKKNGEAKEGYLVKSDGNGVTLASPGGSTTFIAVADIQNQGGVAGKSFMPTAFDQFPDQTIADLVSYIKSLK